MALALGVALPLMVAPSATAGHEYEQLLWFNWDTTELDVIVLGVDDPILGAAILDGIGRWTEGIPQLSPVLEDTLEIRVYFPALDPIPPPGFEPADIEIYFVTKGFMSVQHDGPERVCVAFAPMIAGWGSPGHVAAHEFGHCLGLGHVFNHGAEYQPAFDIMGNGDGSRSCPSNLNIMVLERVFGGQTGGVAVPSASYVQASC